MSRRSDENSELLPSLNPMIREEAEEEEEEEKSEYRNGPRIFRETLTVFPEREEIISWKDKAYHSAYITGAFLIPALLSGGLRSGIITFVNTLTYTGIFFGSESLFRYLFETKQLLTYPMAALLTSTSIRSKMISQPARGWIGLGFGVAYYQLAKSPPDLSYPDDPFVRPLPPIRFTSDQVHEKKLARTYMADYVSDRINIFLEEDRRTDRLFVIPSQDTIDSLNTSQKRLRPQVSVESPEETHL